MNFQERKQKILDLVEREGSVDVKRLALHLDISEITIRRDLAILSEKGMIYRTHGGAMKLSLAHDPISFVQKSAVNADKKDYICQLAAKEVQEGDVIFMDCGSTVFRLCPFIRNMRIKVVTNSLPVMSQLLGSAVSVNFVGGEIDPERQAAHGIIATEHIRRYRANKAFLGVDGISLANGLSAATEKEAEITLSMSANSHETFLLCDSGKFEKDRYFPFAPLSLAQTLITDQEADAEIIEGYEKAGLKVVR